MGVSEPLFFHFDYLSPYAYLGWTQIHALAARHSRSVVAVPTLFAALLNHSGTKGPAEVPSKRIYIWKDVLRSTRLLGIPLAPPPTHPFNPLCALRVSCLVVEPERKRLVDALFSETWGGGQGIETEEKVAAACTRAGFDGAALVREAGTPPAKESLRRQTEEAIAAGVFGVPTVRVEGELFWGYDSFGHLERFLSGEDSIKPEDLSRWTDVVPSAMR